MKTPLTERERIVLAAYFARSNMGQDPADRNHVQRLLKTAGRVTLSCAVADLCGEFMETDEHQDIYEEEAQGWLATFENDLDCDTREKVAAIWPHAKERFWT